MKPDSVSGLRREHVEAFITHLLATRAPATASNRYRALQAFFRWALEEGEIEESPMRAMKPPFIPDQAVPVVETAALTKLLKLADQDRSFEGRRDAAILWLLCDTGMRRGELLGLKVSDLDLDERVAFVLG